MDEQNVEACLMLPTTGVGVEPQLRAPRHREALYPSLRAFNRWLEEDWGYGRDGRIFGAPLCSLVDLGEAIAELDRLLARGARFVILTAGPVDGRSPADPHFDPFWARCEEAGVNVVYHIGRTPFSEIYNVPWGLRPHPPSHRHSLMEYAISFTERPIVDTLTALIADNLFGRFPRLKVLTVEYGSSWAAGVAHEARPHRAAPQHGLWRFGAPPLKPSDTFRSNVWVTPFFEDDVVGARDPARRRSRARGLGLPAPGGPGAAGGVRRRARGTRRPTWCASSCARTSRAWSDPGHAMTQDSRTPVLVGVGAVSQREADPAHAKEPLELMVAALERAAEDAGRRALLARADSIRAPRGFWDYPDPCRLLAERFGASRAQTEIAEIGVLQTTLLGRAAADIAAGRADVVLVVGAEARHRAQRARAAGVDAPLTQQAPVTPDSVLQPHAPILSEREVRAGLMHAGRPVRDDRERAARGRRRSRSTRTGARSRACGRRSRVSPPGIPTPGPARR